MDRKKEIIILMCVNEFLKPPSYLDDDEDDLVVEGSKNQSYNRKIESYVEHIIGAFHLHQNSDKSHFCLSSTFMLKKDRSEIYLSFDVNGKHLIPSFSDEHFKSHFRDIIIVIIFNFFIYMLSYDIYMI